MNHQSTHQASSDSNAKLQQASTAFRREASAPGLVLQRAQCSPRSLTAAGIRTLQRTIGNRATGRLLAQQLPVQTESQLGTVDDKSEQEADTVVHRLATQPVQREDAEESIQKSKRNVVGLLSFPSAQIPLPKRVFSAAKVQRDEELSEGLEDTIQANPLIRATSPVHERISPSQNAGIFAGHQVLQRAAHEKPSVGSGQTADARWPDISQAVQRPDYRLRNPFSAQSDTIQRGLGEDIEEEFAESAEKSGDEFKSGGIDTEETTAARSDPRYQARGGLGPGKHPAYSLIAEAYEGENQDSLKFLAEKLMGASVNDLLQMDLSQLNSRLSRMGWTSDEVKELFDTKKVGVTYIKHEDERAQYKLRIGSEIQQGTPPKTWDTRELFTNGVGKGHGIFVMSSDGTFYGGTHKMSRFHHSSFLAGAPVAAGGSMEAPNGKLKEITNKTGHYQSRPLHMAQVVRELADHGITSSSFGVRVFPEDDTVIPGDKFLQSENDEIIAANNMVYSEDAPEFTQVYVDD